MKNPKEGLLRDKFVHDGLVFKRVEDTEGKLKPGFYIYSVNKDWYEAFYSPNNEVPYYEELGNTAYCCKSLDEAWECIGILEEKLKQGKLKKKVPEAQNFY